MKSVGVAGFALVVMMMLGTITASPASALPCWETTLTGEGLYRDAHCLQPGGTNDYILGTFERNLGRGQGCIRVRTETTGEYTTNSCVTRQALSNYAKVNIIEVCVRVRTGTGDFDTSACDTNTNRREYIKAIATVDPGTVGKGIACLPVAEAETGRYKTEGGCVEGTESEESGGSFIRADVEENCIGEVVYPEVRAIRLTANTSAGDSDSISTSLSTLVDPTDSPAAWLEVGGL
jgi:hypothetical protein